MNGISPIFFELNQDNNITENQLWTKINLGENILIIDVRSENQYFEGHIPTAINLPVQAQANQTQLNIINSYNKSENIFYCSCTDGSNAKLLMELLNSIGLKNGFYMVDDFRYWSYDIFEGSNPGIWTTVPSNSLTNNNNNNNISNDE